MYIIITIYGHVKKSVMPLFIFWIIFLLDLELNFMGVVGWCEGVMYLVSPGRPTDIGLQLGKACYRCSR